MTKRSRNTILSKILGICSNGANKTRIVYQANLNFRTVGPYLKLLSDNGLIDVKDGKMVIYETTQRGQNLMEDIKLAQNGLGI